ncbi:MAG: hypothetical protein R2747_17170 [Pyrinomonadaceae bacterium]
MAKKKRVSTTAAVVSICGFIFLICGLFYFAFRTTSRSGPPEMTRTGTLFGAKKELGEPFGIAYRDGETFVSDGETGKILRISDGDNFTVLTDRLNTPSAIAFDPEGDLIVADTGAHTIKKVEISTGQVSVLAGVEDRKGFADGPADQALFNGPIGLAVAPDGRIFVADTYNDRIRLIENGRVSTVAGDTEGFADGSPDRARFDTPCGIALTGDGKLIVADTGNFRLRLIDENGAVQTLAGNGQQGVIDGSLFEAGFVRPLAVEVDRFGVIYVADGNSIRALGRRFFPGVETLTDTWLGFSDGEAKDSRFSRPSGLALDEEGNLIVADADNRVVRILSDDPKGRQMAPEEIAALGESAEEFRQMSPPRWPYDPPERVREIAGTLGEIRGEIEDADSEVWFHNGLDITGGYGERARFIRTEKVLDPLAVQNFATSRELIRLPTLGYIHIRLGRNVNSAVFNDHRFQFSVDDEGDLKSLRVPRGTEFKAGEAIGTLNPMNHVHLIAGRRGLEMNALDALILPGVSDSRTPTIEKVSLFDENWREFETEKRDERINLTGKTRIVVRAYDQMDGNADRRRLGVYRLGYQILKDETPLGEIKWTIRFDRMPDERAVKFVYAPGSRSGATGQTIFNYIVTNEVEGDQFREGFFDASLLEKGEYVLRVVAADFFGNQARSDVRFSIGD